MLKMTRESGTITYSWWECKSTLWNQSVLRVLKKTKIQQPYIPPHHSWTCNRSQQAGIAEGTAAFSIVKIWDQSSMTGWRKRGKNTWRIVFFSHKGEWIHVICKKMNGMRDHQVNQSKPDLEDKYFLSFAKSSFKHTHTCIHICIYTHAFMHASTTHRYMYTHALM